MFSLVSCDHISFSFCKEMVYIETQYFNVNKILLLAIGLWPYRQSKIDRLQIIFFSGILFSAILFQVSLFKIAVQHVIIYFIHCN
jgi:hypothetical protein